MQYLIKRFSIRLSVVFETTHCVQGGYCFKRLRGCSHRAGGLLPFNYGESCALYRCAANPCSRDSGGKDRDYKRRYGASGPKLSRTVVKMTDQFLQPYSIGIKLRTLRVEKQLTLSRLAAETNLSTALLSKLETNRMIPTLPTLAKICRVYGVGLGYFFSDAEEHTVAITRKAHTLQNSRAQQAVRMIPLHMPRPESKVNTTMLEFPPGVDARIREDGDRSEITVYVTEGILEITVAGEKERLEGGDCAVINTSGLVVMGAGGSGTCGALVVNVSD
jgi:transcriptional regulator with XRE-family HTH domain